MAAITICSDFGKSLQKNKVSHCFHCFPIYGSWSDGTRCHDLSFLNVEPSAAAVAAAKSLQLCPTLCDPHRRQPTRLRRPWDSPGKNTGVGCHFLLQCMKGKSESELAQSSLTLSDPMDCSLSGSSVHGIFQTRGWAPPKFCRASGPLNPPIFIYMGIQTWKPSGARAFGDIAQGVLRWVFSLWQSPPPLIQKTLIGLPGPWAGLWKAQTGLLSTVTEWMWSLRFNSGNTAVPQIQKTLFVTISMLFTHQPSFIC